LDTYHPTLGGFFMVIKSNCFLKAFNLIIEF